MSIVDFMFAEQLLMTNCLIKGEYIAFTNSFLCQYSQVYKMLQETSFQNISFSRSQPCFIKSRLAGTFEEKQKEASMIL
jgi:hypothetical protein